jgi:hypothetical protein
MIELQGYQLEKRVNKPDNPDKSFLGWLGWQAGRDVNL